MKWTIGGLADEFYSRIKKYYDDPDYWPYENREESPVYMILGQSAGTAAVLAIENNQSIQELSYDQLVQILLKKRTEAEIGWIYQTIRYLILQSISIQYKRPPSKTD